MVVALHIGTVIQYGARVRVSSVAVASDGSIWFTDPTYGIGGNYEGIIDGCEASRN
jgi:sugar lactone lactonase YvrE